MLVPYKLTHNEGTFTMASQYTQGQQLQWHLHGSCLPAKWALPIYNWVSWEQAEFRRCVETGKAFMILFSGEGFYDFVWFTLCVPQGLKGGVRALLYLHGIKLTQMRNLQIKGRRQIWRSRRGRMKQNSRDIKIICAKYHLAPSVVL